MAEFRLANFTSGSPLTAAELNTGLTFTDYTPDWTQGVAITKTVNWARYTKFGKLIVGTIKMTSTGAGTANTKVTVSLPVSASSNNFIIGTMNYVDDSVAVAKYKFQPMSAYFDSSTTMSFSPARIGGALTYFSDNDKRFGENFTADSSALTGVTVASSDIIYIQFQYEAA